MLDYSYIDIGVYHLYKKEILLCHIRKMHLLNRTANMKDDGHTLQDGTI